MKYLAAILFICVALPAISQNTAAKIKPEADRIAEEVFTPSQLNGI